MSLKKLYGKGDIKESGRAPQKGDNKGAQTDDRRTPQSEKGLSRESRQTSLGSYYRGYRVYYIQNPRVYYIQNPKRQCGDPRDRTTRGYLQQPKGA